MAHAGHKELVNYLDEQVGEYLRAAFVIDESDLEILWVRPDLRTEETRDILPTLRKRVEERKAILRSQEDSPLGELAATTEIHEDGILLYFAGQGDDGVIITLDRKAGRDLVAFVENCAKIVNRYEPASTS